MKNSKLVYEDDAVGVFVRSGRAGTDGGSVLLSFTGIGHAMGGADLQQLEFYGSGREFDDTVFIIDKGRSWANSLDFSLIKEVVQPFIDGRKIYSIGNSMGGFISIVSSHYFPVCRSISFAPQFSVHPEDVPWESRWRKYTRSIQNYSVRNVEGYFSDKTSYYIFSGGVGPDLMHANLFPARSNIFHYVLRGVAHDVALCLKEREMLAKLIARCFWGDGCVREITYDFEQISPVLIGS